MLRTAFSFAFVSALASFAPPARAQYAEPGSLLVFPEYDTRPGTATLLTVTNTGAGDTVAVHFYYVDAANCFVLDRRETMTPFDSFTVSVALHNPDIGRGYVYAYAQSDTSSMPIAYDFLIGCVTNIDGFLSFAYTMNAFSFRSSILPQGAPTDIDADGIRDLDGLEYQAAPDLLHVPRFIGQLGPFGSSANFSSSVILIALSGGMQFRSMVGFRIFNDNEQQYSASYRFRCWTKVPLTTISGAFRNDFLLASNDDPTETVGSGREAGWFSIDGIVAASHEAVIDNPAVLAVLTDPASLASSELPFTRGTQTNGDLLPTGVLGDP